MFAQISSVGDEGKGEAEVDIFHSPRSHDPRFPGCLVRVTLRMQQRPAFIEDIG